MRHLCRMMFALVALIVAMRRGRPRAGQSVPYRRGLGEIPRWQEVGIHVRSRRRSGRQHLGF